MSATPKGALWGEGAANTGKTTLGGVLEAVLGNNTASVTIQQMGDQEFRLGQLKGVMANIVGDADNSPVKNSSPFKSATSGKAEKQTANRKHRDMEELRVRCPMLFFGNERPKAPGDRSDALEIRMIVVPMRRKFENKPGSQKPDIHIERKMNRELAGIFNRGLRALQSMLTDPKGWQWRIPEEVLRAQEENIRASNQAAAWAEDSTAVAPDDVFLSKDLAAEDYRAWGEGQGWKQSVPKDKKVGGVTYLWSDTYFKQQVTKMWGGSRKPIIGGKQTPAWRGRRLLNPAERRAKAEAEDRHARGNPQGEREGEGRCGEGGPSEAEEEVIRTAQQTGGTARKMEGGWVVDQEEGRETIVDEHGDEVELMTAEEQAEWERQEREERKEYEAF